MVYEEKNFATNLWHRFQLFLVLKDLETLMYKNTKGTSWILSLKTTKLKGTKTVATKSQNQIYP